MGYHTYVMDVTHLLWLSLEVDGLKSETSKKIKWKLLMITGSGQEKDTIYFKKMNTI